MRCPDCCKFVSYEDPPECEQNGDMSLDGNTLSTNVTVNLNCGDCGTQLKTAEIDVEAEFTHECRSDGKPDDDYKEGEEQFKVESEGDLDGISRQETVDRKGKPIKNPRYAKTFYGFSQNVQVRCRKCGDTFNVELTGEEQASAFSEA